MPATATQPAVATAPTCGDCPFWSAPATRDERTDENMWRATGKHRGPCHRFPATVLKEAGEVCGEHPVMVRARERPPMMTEAPGAADADTKPGGLRFRRR